MGAGVVTFWCALWKFDSDSLFLEATQLFQSTEKYVVSKNINKKNKIKNL